MKNINSKCYLILIVSFCTISVNIAQTRDTLFLWPNKVPGESEAKHKAIQGEDNGGNVLRIVSVTNPALIVFEPEESNNNGSGIIISPGGSYRALALDKEGYEVASWLNTLGFTAFVLQYRVPDKIEGALNDIQRAIKVVRSMKDKWKLKSDKIGVVGFSAGASLSVRASTRYNIETYPMTDDIDTISCRPDFGVLIYPAYLDKGENRTLTPELLVDKNTPEMFIFATADDFYGNSGIVMAGALRDNKVPVELHILPHGGHGYGLRSGNIAGETWPKLAEIWLKNILSR